MKLNNKTFLIAGLVSLLLGAVFLFTQVGQAQNDGHSLPLPQLEPMLVSSVSDSWNVPVRNACLVDSVTVKAGETTTRTGTFNTSSRTNAAGAAASAEGKVACEDAKAAARKELPKELWQRGDNLCKEEEKAPAGGTQCVAVRGNLKGGDIQCSCTYKGLNPIQGLSSEWEVKATCTNTKAVDYVCDP